MPKKINKTPEWSANHELPFKKRKQIKTFLDFNSSKETKTIVLRYAQYKQANAITWEGVSKKDEYLTEKPLTLTFNGKNFYFYSKGINIIKHTKKNWISYQRELDYHHQEEVFTTFAKIINQKNLDLQRVLLKLKLDFLKNKIDSLKKKWKFEKELFNNDNEILVKEAKNFIKQTAKLKNKINNVYRNVHTLPNHIEKYIKNNIQKPIPFTVEFIHPTSNQNVILEQNITLDNEADEIKNIKKQYKNDIEKYDEIIEHVSNTLVNFSNKFENLKKMLKENKESSILIDSHPEVSSISVDCNKEKRKNSEKNNQPPLKKQKITENLTNDLLKQNKPFLDLDELELT